MGFSNEEVEALSQYFQEYSVSVGAKSSLGTNLESDHLEIREHLNFILDTKRLGGDWKRLKGYEDIVTSNNLNALQVFSFLGGTKEQMLEKFLEQGEASVYLGRRVSPEQINRVIRILHREGSLPSQMNQFLETYNLSFPVRHPIGILQEMYDDLESPEKSKKPKALIITAKTDWNNADMSKDNNHLLDIMLGHNVEIYEAGSVEEIRTLIQEVGTKTPIDMFYLRGHGNPEIIDLGFSVKSRINNSLDKESLQELSGLEDCFTSTAKGILHSCSVGAGGERKYCIPDCYYAWSKRDARF